MDGSGKPIFKWMIWGYPSLFPEKHPCTSYSISVLSSLLTDRSRCISTAPAPILIPANGPLIRNNKTHIGPHRLLLKWIAVSSFRTFQNQGDSNRVHVRWILVGRRWKLLFPNECVLFVWDTWQDIFVGEVAFTCPGMARIVVRTKDSHPCLWLRWFGMLPHGWRNWKVIFQQAVKRCEMTICGLCVVVKRGVTRENLAPIQDQGKHYLFLHLIMW